MASSKADFKANNNESGSVKVDKANDAELKANDNSSENIIKVEEALSEELVFMRVQKIMSEYLGDDVEAKTLSGNRFNIFGVDVIKRRAEAVARDYVISASPLDALANEIKKTPYALLPIVTIPFEIAGEELVLRGTLEQLARMLLDLTVVTEKGFVVPGCAETLRDLRQKLLPDTMAQAEDEAKQVALYDAKENAVHLVKLNEAFDLVRDRKGGAGEVIKKYIKSLKPTIITDDRYFFDVLQLLPMAFGVLSNRWDELKTWDQVKRYCFEVIRDVIEESLSDRQQQVLRGSVDALLNEDKEPARIVKRAGGRQILHILHPGSFYDDLGSRGHAGARSVCALVAVRVDIFKTYFKLLHQPPKIMRRPGSQTKSRCVTM